MAALVRRLPVVAHARRTTLICGPTGSGKDVVARWLHEHGRAPSSPFVVVHCGALSDTLAEAELFGHRRGAFTGAAVERKGLVACAADGTLFLDDVDALSQGVQAKLLRLLETGEYRALGSDRTEVARCWVLASSNANLSMLVKQKLFRSDLLFRLEVMRLDLPSLRERREDILPLADAFLAELHDPPKRLTCSGRQALLAYDWPGNVRELKHRIERAALEAPDQQVSADDLGLPAPQPTPQVVAPHEEDQLDTALWRMVHDHGLSLPDVLRVCERSLLASALKAEDGNRTRAAERLGIHVRTVFKKLADPAEDSEARPR